VREKKKKTGSYFSSVLGSFPSGDEEATGEWRRPLPVFVGRFAGRQELLFFSERRIDYPRCNCSSFSKISSSSAGTLMPQVRLATSST